MALSTSTRKPNTCEEDRPEQRRRAPGSSALADYDAETCARAAGDGIPREWPACTCDADHCPDKGAA